MSWEGIRFHRDYLVYSLVVVIFTVVFLYLNNGTVSEELISRTSHEQFSQIADFVAFGRQGTAVYDLGEEILSLKASGDCFVVLDTNGDAVLKLGDDSDALVFAEACARLTPGRTRDTIAGVTMICDSTVLPDGRVIAKAQPFAPQVHGRNILIFILGLSALLFAGLIEYSRKKKTSAYDWLLNRMTAGYSSELKPYEVNGVKALMSLHIGFIGVIFCFLVYRLATSDDPLTLAIDFAGIVLAFALFMMYSSRQMLKKMSLPLILIAELVPFLFHVLGGGFHNGSGAALVWMLPGMLLGLFLLDRRSARRVYYGYIGLLFLDLLIEVFIMQTPDGDGVFELCSGLFFLGFALFSALEQYVGRSTKNYREIETVYRQLQDAQTMLVQREKIGTLGRLVAGIAHEINTPVGAIKASAESLSAAVPQASAKLLAGGRALTDDDCRAFDKLIEMATASVNEMKSTIELRKAKRELQAYLEEIHIPRADAIVDLLYRMEICEIEKVESNIDIFRKENIIDLLKLMNAMTPFITGTQTILFASGRVSKIVFALKSYVHDSDQSSRVYFDMVSNIETVLVLCQNQLKQGITVLRTFEDIPPVYGNPDELGQVWTNIMQNSIYAMKEVGTLSLSVTMPDSETVEVTIGDTGPGIPETEIQRIFEPFYTTKPLGEGSGLGLDICRKIITEHRGVIEVESEVGTGTIFRVRMPARAEEPRDE